MLTQAQLDANKANAQLSTGPKTPEGKAKSSRNALRYGIYSMTGLLDHEDPAEFKTLADGMLRDLRPFNITETELINQLIDIQWRLRRVSARESDIFGADVPDFKALNNLSLHAARLKRQFTATLKEFQDLHTATSKSRDALFDRAEIIYRADAILNRPSTLRFHGFEFTVEDMEYWRERNIAFVDAQNAVEEWEAQRDQPPTGKSGDKMPLAA